MKINERLQQAAQAIDELFSDHQAEAADRYQRLMAELQNREDVPPSAIDNDAPAAPAPRLVSFHGAPDTEPQQVPTEYPDLTERQRKILMAIRDSFQRLGRAPSMREIANVVWLPYSSVADQLMALERKGYLRRDPNRPRTYVVQSSDSAPTSGQYSRKAGRAPTPGHGTDSRNAGEPLPAQPGDEA
jgi:hypothetical protein